MFICLATLKTENEVIKYNIVTEQKEVDYNKSPIRVHISTPIADCIMKTIANDRHTFTCNDVSYTVLSASLNSKFNEYNPYYRRKVDFTNITNPQKIYIYKRNSHCEKCRRKGLDSSIECVSAAVSCILNVHETHIIEVQYCKRCKTYFVDEESLKIFEKKYGTLLFERIFETHNSDDIEWDYEYANDTILSRYGYTAKENALTKKERQFILSYIIENNIAEKAELKSILSTFIKLRGDRCYKAEPIWREDLKFLNEYNLNDNRFIGNSVLIRKNKT